MSAADRLFAWCFSHGRQLLFAAWALWNLIAFFTVAFDKYRAKHDMRRMRERTMLLYAATFAGGGVLAAFYLFRHKTKHHALLFWVWFFFLLSVFAAAAIAWLSLRAAL